MPRLTLLVVLLLMLVPLCAQNNLFMSGLNEAKYIYRTTPDSLHSYFSDSFSYSFSFKEFSFGMKFIAELPKYSTNQSELLAELTADRLSLGWKELYLSFTKDTYQVYAGTIEETFGGGLVFRSYRDIELDQDHRVTGFKFNYDDLFRVKALYSAITNPTQAGKLDLAYGLDAEVPFSDLFTLGASAVTMRNLTAFDNYSENDVYGGRVKFQSGVVEFVGEYAQRELYDRGPSLEPISGQALNTSLGLNFEPIQFGALYKNYNSFSYRLQNLPLANHHSETLADNQSSGEDEEGAQGWVNFMLFNDFSFNLDYAEAWNADRTKRMNDAYAGVEWMSDNVTATVSYSQIEKVDTGISHWQKESYPEAHVSFPVGKLNIVASGQFKTVSKQAYDVLSTHYEPQLQADVKLGKLGLSLAGGSSWQDFQALLEDSYWANLEAKYPILEGTELTFFAGQEPGGKVCRNGVCRYVAPFAGIRAELSTRF